jgi:hypothetical protein
MDNLTFPPAPGNDPDPIAYGDAAESAGAIKPSPSTSASRDESNNPTQEQVTGQLIDRYGHVHSEAIFKNWSPAAIKGDGYSPR